MTGKPCHSEDAHVFVICPCCHGGAEPECELCEGQGTCYNVDALKWMGEIV